MLQMLRHLFKATNSTSNSAEGGTSLTAFFYFGSLLSESELNKKGDAVTLSASGFSHSFYFFFSLVLQEGSRMISRCCCLLWLNIQTKKVCVTVRVCFSGAGPSFPVCLSLSTAALHENALQPVG